MTAASHRARVGALFEVYDTKMMTLATTAKVRDYLNKVGLPSTIQQAYDADIEARNLLAADKTTPTFVPAALVPDDQGQHVRNPTGMADEDIRSELAMERRVCSEVENMANRVAKMGDKHPKDNDIQRLVAVTARLETQAVKTRHLTESIIDSRF